MSRQAKVSTNSKIDSKLCYNVIKIDDEFNHKLFEIPNKKIGADKLNTIINDFSAYIKASQHDISYYFGLLERFCVARPKHNFTLIPPLFECILKAFSKTKEDVRDDISKMNIVFYLICYPELEEFEQENKETLTVLDLLKEDDINGFKQYLAKHPKFDINAYLPLELGSYYYYINGTFKCVSLINFCCDFGSHECLKFLLMKKCEIPGTAGEYAVRGCSQEIIDMLARRTSFENTHELAIRYHQYKIFYWLLAKHIRYHEKCTLGACLRCYNYTAFLYFFNKEKEKPQSLISALRGASSIGHQQLTKYLADNGVVLKKGDESDEEDEDWESEDEETEEDESEE